MGKLKLVSKDVGGVVVRIGHGSELNSEFTSFLLYECSRERELDWLLKSEERLIAGVRNKVLSHGLVAMNLSGNRVLSLSASFNF
jgi:hypothetical protein